MAIMADKIEPPPPPRRARSWHWLLWLPLAALFMLRWWSAALPISPRGELAPELGYLWLLRRLWEGGGILTGWNPLLLGGEPTATARMFHLYALLALLSRLPLLGPESVLKLTQFGALLLAGWGTYGYVRQIKGSPYAALVAAAVFGFFPARVLLTVEALFVALAWAGLPWVIWAYERTRVALRGRIRAAVGWGVALAWVALTATQWLILLVTPLALYIFLRESCEAVSARSWTGSAQALKRVVLTSLIAGAVCVGLSLFYYLPSVVERHELWLNTYASAYPGTARWIVPWSLVLRILGRRWLPGFEPFGWNLVRILPDISWYLGLVAGGLALVGATGFRRWTHILPLLGVLLVSMMLAAGPSIPRNPTYAVVRRIPYLADTVRDAFRYLWPASWAIAGLAALGMERIIARIARRRWRWGVMGLALALVILDYGPLTQAFGVTNSYFEADEIAVHQWLGQATGDERYWVPFQVERAGRHYLDTSLGPLYDPRASINDDEFHTASAPYRASLLFGQALRGVGEPRNLEKQGGFSPTAQAILELANVRYALLYPWPEGYEVAITSLLATGKWEILRRSEHVVLLENRAVRAYAQDYSAGFAANGIKDAALLELLPQTLGQGYALVETPGVATGLQGLALARPLAEATAGSLAPAATATAQLAVAKPQPQEVRVKFSAAQPFLLMVSQTWYPHWRVTVNGQERPLLRLNGNFLGVAISEGEGQAVFRYQSPWYVAAGGIVSAATLVGVLVLLLRRKKAHVVRVV